jgi:hypothetical protein
MKNGRCRMHGGKAGRKPTHGRYTKAALAARKQRRSAREALRVLRALVRLGYGETVREALRKRAAAMVSQQK